MGRRRGARGAGEEYRLLFVCSAGGHLAQLHLLEPWWSRHDRAWVTFELPDASARLTGERVYFGHHPTTRNVVNLIRNLGVAWRVLRAERPTVIMSNGAGLAVPFFWLGRAMGAKTVYLEVYDRIDSRTMTARLCRPVTDLFLVQWPEQLALYPGAVLVGSLY